MTQPKVTIEKFSIYSESDTQHPKGKAAIVTATISEKGFTRES
jgi:hypothetical protein